MRRRWWLVALGLVALALGAGLRARPAAADDCSSRAKGIGDLGDPAVVSDCLRTGSDWGRTIGTVVAVSGLTISVVGLRTPIRPSRQPREEPGNEPEGLHSADACVRAAARVRRIQQLEADRLQLEKEILDEFRVLSTEALTLANAYRTLKEIEYRVNAATAFAVTFNAAMLANAVLTVAGSLATLALAADATAPAAVALATRIAGQSGEVAGAIAARQAFQQAAMKASQATLTSAAIPFTAAGMGTLKPDPWGDPTASRMKDAMMQGLMKTANDYMATARAFNQSAGQWAVNRQQDLETGRERLKQEAAQWLDDAQQCPTAPDPWGGMTPKLPDIVTLHVPQARVGFGDTWILGGMVY